MEALFVSNIIRFLVALSFVGEWSRLTLGMQISCRYLSYLSYTFSFSKLDRGDCPEIF